MPSKKKATPIQPTSADADTPKLAFETFEQFYNVWLAKYSEHGNYPTRYEAMREAWNAARLTSG